MKKIAIFGGSFNPPGVHHREIARHLGREFDEVRVVPCGPRPDKDGVEDVEPVHRATLVDLAFRGLPNVRVEHFDLEKSTFTTTHELAKVLGSEGEIWFVIGTDLLGTEEQGSSPIRTQWYRGEELWKSCRFAIVTRAGGNGVAELPPRHAIYDLQLEGSSSEIRERLFKGHCVDELLVPEVRSYIRRHGLYQGRLPRTMTRVSLGKPSVFLEIDEKNDAASALGKRFQGVEDPDAANLIVAIGGDGTMLHAIRKHWRRRLPFFGLNAGHRGFLLNDVEEVLDAEFSYENLILRQLPLLYVQTEKPDGSTESLLAFNDAWVERRTGQSAWVEVRINGAVQLPKVIGDGVLLATAAGSTAYARALGATPLLVDSQALLMVGSNVMEPSSWKSAHLSLDSSVQFRTLDHDKRPIVAYADGIPLGDVLSLEARVSRTAAVELAFTANHDMGKKLAEIQFPR